MFVKTKPLMLGTLSCCVGLWAYAAPFMNVRVVSTTPRTTISALHGLHTLTPQQPLIADMMRNLNRDSLASLSAGKRSVLEQYDPKLFGLHPDAESLSNRVRGDLTSRAQAAPSQLCVSQIDRLASQRLCPSRTLTFAPNANLRVAATGSPRCTAPAHP